MRTELTRSAKLKALVLFKRISEDLDPDRFTAKELHQEGTEGGAATVGELRVRTGNCLALLVALGYVGRLGKTAYAVTDEGRALDYEAEIKQLAPSEL